MTIHSPDDELDERWKALHEHPEFGRIPNFDAVDLPEKSHANDPKPTLKQPKKIQRRHSDSGSDTVDNETADQELGHELLMQDYQNWLRRPRVIEVDDSSL